MSLRTKVCRRLSILTLGLGLSIPWPGRADPAPAVRTVPPSGQPARTVGDDALLDEMEKRAFRYFQDQSDRRTGLIRDRARADGTPSEGKASIAASGFALSAWVIATQRGWVDRATAVTRIRMALHFLAEQAPRRHGFFYHFMEMDSGRRAWGCEVSPIDTGLFLAGAIVARQYFSDPEITGLVNKLSHEVDWEWFLNGGKTLALSWNDEHGFSRYRWDHYSEAIMLSFLGMGASEHPLPVTYWDAWTREPVGTYAGDHFIEGAPLFIHQYTHAYVDFRERRDAYADYFHNSILASLAQRQFCRDLHGEFPAWDDRLWGLTSSDSDNGYRSWGGPPRTTGQNSLDGTLAPCAVAGSLPFVPSEAIATLRTMRTEYGDRIWRRYGFADAFNPVNGWADSDVIGIDLGIAMLQAENVRTGLIWTIFSQAPELQLALKRAGFVSTRRDLTADERLAWQKLAARTWQLIQASPVDADSLGFALSATLGARSLGLIGEADAETRLGTILRVTLPPNNEEALVTYAASLLAVRQSFPGQAAEASRRFTAIDWKHVTAGSRSLSSISRLTVFLQIAAGARPSTEWVRLSRDTESLGQVRILNPPEVHGLLIPGLWLDERLIVTGASAAQLAYAIAIDKRQTSTAAYPYDVPNTALLLEHLPAEASASLRSTPIPNGWLEQALPANRYLLFLSLTNLLASDALRSAFQKDPVAIAGRAAIPEFRFAAFGDHNSVYARNELAAPSPAPLERHAAVVRAETPPKQWPWVDVKGPGFKCSDADVRPGDPDLGLRFALTWDPKELHLHAQVMDSPPGFPAPAGQRSVELFINPNGTGLVWQGSNDFQFAYQPDGLAMEWFHNRPASAKIHATPGGYSVDSDIPWQQLGLIPKPGLEFGLTVNVSAGGISEWDPALELSWRFYRVGEDLAKLGTVRLMP